MAPLITQLPDSNTSDDSSVERLTWEEGDGCVSVEHLKVIGGGHDWPGSFGNMDIDATQEIWQFVSQYDLDGLIECATTSTNEINGSTLNFKTYPNPTNGELTIEINSSERKEFKIFSTLGELVLTGNLDADINTIDLSSLPSNIYILNIDNQSIRIVKTK